MKRKIFTFGIVFFAISLLASVTSCKKVIDDIVDCLGDQSLTSINVSVDPVNTKVYTFHVSYGGTHNLGTVKWKFGDGAEATTTGSQTITHTYEAGTFNLRADATISHNDESCTMNLTKTVVVTD